MVDRALKSADIVGRVPSILGIRPGQTDEEGWAAIDEFFADTDDGRKRRKALEDCIDENAYHFHAHGVELGHRYTSTAVVGDGTPFPAHTRDPELYYQPTTHPGAYLPHVWIERNGEQISTLDAVGHGRFTVITGIGGEAWVAAAEKIGAEVGVEIASAPIGYRLAFDDVYGDWARAREISDGGCLLVRPDRHIAWRSHGMADDPLSALREAIDAVLSRV